MGFPVRCETVNPDVDHAKLNQAMLHTEVPPIYFSDMGSHMSTTLAGMKVFMKCQENMRWSYSPRNQLPKFGTSKS